MTRFFRDAQLLNGERVTAVSVLQAGITPRASFRLELQFSSSVPAHVPRRVFFKLVAPQIVREWGRERAFHELDFYTSVTRSLTPSLQSMGVVRCLDAATEPDGAAHLVLEDLSATHGQPEWPVPPTRARVERLVDWAAMFHGTWWQNPDVRLLPRPRVSLDQVEASAERHLCEISELLTEAEKTRMRLAYGFIGRLWEQGHIGPPPAHAFTLTHGDLHFWNVLYPQAPSDNLAVVDWEFWDVAHPMTEVAYLIGLNWDRSRDPADERALVERYHQALTRTGRIAYAWEDCWHDYRLGMIAMFLVPAAFRERKLAASVWWPHQRRVLEAYERLGCDELLAGPH